MEDLQQLFTEWSGAVSKRNNQLANDVLATARRSVPNVKANGRWDWFRKSLEQGGEPCSFALAVLSKHSIPKALLSDILTAAFHHSDASTIKFYILPCIKTYGIELVDQKLLALSKEFENGWEKYIMARYWYAAAKSK